MQSKAKTVENYLAELLPERREAISAVRKVIKRNLDKDYEEGMQYGMIGYYVPHRIYPAGYHCDPKLPLCFAGLASQKNYMSVYLMTAYGPDAKWFAKAWAHSGKMLDMGKSCIRFKRLEDLALEVVGEAIRRMPARKFIEFYETATAGRRKGAKMKEPAKATKSKPAGKPRKSAKKPTGGTKAGRKKVAR